MLSPPPTNTVVANRSNIASFRDRCTYLKNRPYTGNYRNYEYDSTYNYICDPRAEDIRSFSRDNSYDTYGSQSLSRQSSSDIVVTEVPAPLRPRPRRALTAPIKHRRIEHPVPEEPAFEPAPRHRYKRDPSPASRDERLPLKLSRYTNTKIRPWLPPFPMYATPLVTTKSRSSTNHASLTRSPDVHALVSLAAHYSNRVYVPVSHTGDDWLLATSSPSPSASTRTIVLAIRGTAGVSDWLTNLAMHHVPSNGFLSAADYVPGSHRRNLFHEGFLNRARNMVRSVARRLRRVLLPLASTSEPLDLLITGHSAGGAVAALLYMHMLSKPAWEGSESRSRSRSRSQSRSESRGRGRSATPPQLSELQLLAPYLRRIHCISFGAPPVSEIPLAQPSAEYTARHARGGLFLGVMNHGDPVVRLDKSYAKSLLELLATSGRHQLTREGNELRWRVPRPELFPAGSLVLLRPWGDNGKEEEDRRKVNDVVAERVGLQDLQKVMWGDIRAHAMELYVDRVRMLWRPRD
ncbi:putative lipase [Ceratocystis lukuohia]|uniref:Lipase n=1 Tax=Ceratocystis lukuohia TaxID=2019550 RepID=A0ABR4MKZ6_9PEZI